MVNMVVSSLLMFFFSGYRGIYFFLSVIWFIRLFSMSTSCFLDLTSNPRVLSISAGYMFSSCAGSFSFFFFVHCFYLLLPLSAAVTGSSLHLFQCLVFFDFSLPLFALSVCSGVTLFSFSNTWFLFLCFVS